MYSRLDVFDDSMGIDITAKTDWNDTLNCTAKKIKPDSLVVGYSMGARLALGLALDHPKNIKALVLISVNAGLANNQARHKRISLDDKLARDFESSFDLALTKFNKNEIFDQNIHNEDHRIKDTQIISDQLKILGLGKMPFYEDRLIELRIPVLYLSGSRDIKYTQLNSLYKKKTPFSQHRILDSDHRIVSSNPLGVDLNIQWFSKYFL